MVLALNVSSSGMQILDTLPSKVSKVNRAEPKFNYRSPLGNWFGGKMATVAHPILSPAQKRELGLRSKLTKA